MKLTEFELDGKVYHLLLNGTALFNIYDHFGADADILELIQGTGRDSHEALLWMASELALQGELYRRVSGEDRGPILQLAQAAATVTPADIPALKLAVSQAVRDGFVRHHKAEDDVDVFLAEIEAQKKTTQSRVRSIFGSLQRSLAFQSVRG